MFTIPVSGPLMLSSLAPTVTRAATIQNNMFRGLLFIACILVMLLILAVTFTAMGPFRRKDTRLAAFALYIAVALVLIVGLVSWFIYGHYRVPQTPQVSATLPTQTTAPTQT